MSLKIAKFMIHIYKVSAMDAFKIGNYIQITLADHVNPHAVIVLII